MEMACRLSGWIGSGRCPHWLIGGNSGTGWVFARIDVGAWHTCLLVGVDRVCVFE